MNNDDSLGPAGSVRHEEGHPSGDVWSPFVQGTEVISSPPATDALVDALRPLLSQSPAFVEALYRARELGLSGWYLAAGCVAQTVWNVVTGCPPEEGIRDYDLPYFDSANLTWEAEDLAIQAGRAAFAGLPCEVEIRNEARVHVWYEEHFGVPCPAYTSAEAAIATFPAVASCIGVRLGPDDAWQIYAPYGVSDLLSLTVRPNLTLAPRHVYVAKVQRWRTQWPGLTILPWPEAGLLTDG